MEIHFFWSWKSHGKSLLKKSGHTETGWSTLWSNYSEYQLSRSRMTEFTITVDDVDDDDVTVEQNSSVFPLPIAISKACGP